MGKQGGRREAGKAGGQQREEPETGRQAAWQEGRASRHTTQWLNRVALHVRFVLDDRQGERTPG